MQITAQDITQAFLPAGFVWQVTLPCDPDGKAKEIATQASVRLRGSSKQAFSFAGASKGFAFASFTARAHAQNAILLMNGKVGTTEVHTSKQIVLVTSAPNFCPAVEH